MEGRGELGAGGGEGEVRAEMGGMKERLGARTGQRRGSAAAVCNVTVFLFLHLHHCGGRGEQELVFDLPPSLSLSFYFLSVPPSLK